MISRTVAVGMSRGGRSITSGGLFQKITVQQLVPRQQQLQRQLIQNNNSIQQISVRTKADVRLGHYGDGTGGILNMKLEFKDIPVWVLLLAFTPFEVFIYRTLYPLDDDE